MPLGRVKWTNDQRGYGFINSEDHDIFFHHSVTENFHDLKEGTVVFVEIVPGEKGLRASLVKEMKIL
jgi:CspA family cold shock protein